MQQFYYLDGKKVIGPISKEELMLTNVAADTLIWYEGIKDWTSIRELPHLFHPISTSTVLPAFAPATPHPPVPIFNESKAAEQTALSLKPAFINKATRREKKIYKWLLVWVFFHCLAIVLSSFHIKGFNNLGESSIEKFWPFVKYTEKRFNMVETQPIEVWKTTSTFNGIFTQYDWSEFSAYVGGVLFLLLLYHVNKKSTGH